LDHLWSINWYPNKSLLLELIMNTDLKNRIQGIIKEEITTALQELEGELLDREDFDPIDPEVKVKGFGTMPRTQLRREIADRISGALTTAKQGMSNGDIELYNSLKQLFSPAGVLQTLISAEISVGEQLNAIRSRGGNRPTQIPKQD